MMTDLTLPLTQSEAFQRTCVQFGLPVNRIETPLGACLVQTRRFPILGAFHLASRGPVTQSDGSVPALLDTVRRHVRGPLVVNAPATQMKMGGVQIAKGAELALIDLRAPEMMRARLQQKWRNQLNKAEGSGLVVIDQPLDPVRHDWFLKAEAKQQRDRGYKSYPAAFLLAFAAVNKGAARLYTALHNGVPIAGMLGLKHGAMATYQAGVTTDLGRQYCAHNLLLWTMMCDLQRRGVTCLDLGRADLSPGLRRFKLGSGARIERLAGSFLFHHWVPPKRTSPRIKKFSRGFRANS